MNQVVSLLLCLASASGLYDGREGRAIDFDAGPSSRQQFNLNDLTPAENDIVYTKFNIIGLNDLDSLPPVNIKSISSVRTVKNTPSVASKPVVPARPRFAPRPQPAVPSSSVPRVSGTRNGHNSGPQFRGAPPPHHPDRNIFNFQPFPRVFNPWHNFYNFAKRPFQDATERNFLEEGRRSELTTPHTTAPTTTTTRTTTTTTTTTTASPVEEYDYHYYDFSSSNSVDTPHHTGHSFNQPSQDLPSPASKDYSYDPGNTLDEDYSYTEYTEYTEQDHQDIDQGINTLTGCPGSLRDCLSACSPVVRINGAAYKICVNECLERC